MNTESRQLAIKNLKGSDEKLRVSWMLSNMKKNKTFIYFQKKKMKSTKNNYLMI